MKRTITKIVSLIMTLLFVVSLNSCGTTRIKEGNIQYDKNAFSNTVNVYSVTLTRENKNVEIVIPDYTSDGAKVVEIGLKTSEGNFKHFRFFLEGAKVSQYDSKYPDIFLPGHVVTDYYVTLNLGKNIKRADPLITESVQYYKIDDTEEFIRVNIYVEVSPDNPYFYSENGVIYEK